MWMIKTEQQWKQRDRENMKKHLRRFLWSFVPYIVAWLVLYFLVDTTAATLLAFAYGGYCIGGMVSYRQGMSDERDIIDFIYGSEWSTHVVVGRLYAEERERREKADFN